ncbi:hypothetical protein [Pseudomonas sp.]|uniref:hypothetical protein n=1 Tax=Pseudomonas sp. TaxID=306 RepID=UPI00258A314F|nr:hypothetical protein [Pseudomonas sp.]
MDMNKSAHSREPAGSSNVRQSTPLEQCMNDQQCNQTQIDDIAERISALIRRLQGQSVGCGSEDDCGEMKSIGMLGEHKAALKLEGQRLGEIQCDLAVLESLL